MPGGFVNEAGTVGLVHVNDFDHQGAGVGFAIFGQGDVDSGARCVGFIGAEQAAVGQIDQSCELGVDRAGHDGNGEFFDDFDSGDSAAATTTGCGSQAQSAPHPSEAAGSGNEVGAGHDAFAGVDQAQRV